MISVFLASFLFFCRITFYGLRVPGLESPHGGSPRVCESWRDSADSVTLNGRVVGILGPRFC